MSKVKNEQYINIQGWMINELQLKGNELIIYAIIYGFSQDKQSRYKGGLQYLADWTNSTKQGVIKNLKSLLEKKYIEKFTYDVNGIVLCEYSTTEFNGIKQSLTGIKQSLPNNIDNNKEENIDNNKLLSIKERKPKQQKQFIPPTLEEVENYCKERNNKVNPKKFYDYYDVNDWKDKNGKNITNWKQKMIANWEGKEEVYSTNQTTYKPKYCNDGYKGKKIDFADYTEEQIKEFIHNKVIDENGVVI